MAKKGVSICYTSPNRAIVTLHPVSMTANQSNVFKTDTCPPIALNAV
jgi:hypothetical protein